MSVITKVSVYLLLALACSSAWAGTQYYVRKDGNDNCNGLVNAPDSLPADPNCAHLTPQHVFQGSPPIFIAGDDLQLGPGDWSRFELPPDVWATAADRTVISGDPSYLRSQIVIDGSIGSGDPNQALFSPGGFDQQHPSRYITVKHLAIKAGTKFGINFQGFHDNVVFDDLESSSTQFTGLCCRNSDPRAALIRIGTDRNYGASNITVQNSQFIGSATVNVGGLQAVDASVIAAWGSPIFVRNVEARFFHGSFVHEASDGSIIENNLVSHTTCNGGYGCVYSYDDSNIVVRRNVFDQVRAYEYFTPVVLIRQNYRSSHQTNIVLYNNTIIGTGINYDIGLLVHHDGGESVPVNGVVALNNIFMGLGSNTFNSYALQVDMCPDPNSTIQPSLQVDYNNYWNNVSGRDYSIPSACSSGQNANSRSVDPNLNVLYQPPDLHELCTAGSQTYTAPDGDHPDPWMGARQCAPPGGGGGGGFCNDCHRCICQE